MDKISKKMRNLPKIIKSFRENTNNDNFPLDHYSYSSLVRFSTNPIMFKIRYMNRDHIDSTRNISGVTGNAFHTAMQAYYAEKMVDEQSAIKKALETGMDYLSGYDDGFIEFSTTVENKQKAQEILAFTINSYIQSKKDDNEKIVMLEDVIEEEIDIEWKGKRINLPVKLKGYIDKITRRVDGRLIIRDYKTCRAFSDPDKIDGSKILQAVQYFLLVYAKYGEAPYSMIFEEIKTTKNSGKNKEESQIKEYEIVYEDNDLFFDFYFRFYFDVTAAINGEAVFVPNVNDFYDNEVAMIAYIHRLDMAEDRARLMKEASVNNITDLLKTKIKNAGNMRQFMKMAEKKFISAKNLNYEIMQNEEKIQTKLMEHGMLVRFDSKTEGYSFDLYRYSPSIGLKMSKIKSYVADVEQVIGVSGVRILAPIPNTSLIGFEIPRKERRFPELRADPDGFNIAIGVDIQGKGYRFDLRKAPHLLIAGATGSGKSVFLNSIISQLCSINNIDLHLFDPKMVELSRFKQEKNVVQYYHEIEDIYLALDGLITEMNERYVQLAGSGAINIEEYKGEMRYKFVIIDEFGDLIVGDKKDGKLNFSKEINKSILILAQKARACGIHLIIATQRPSVNIITGSIKANFPTKVAFRTAKAIDSQVLLDENGAEKLLGKGDMIFSSDECQIRLQGFSA